MSREKDTSKAIDDVTALITRLRAEGWIMARDPEEMAPIIVRRWCSSERRGVKQRDLPARIRDLTKGLIAHYEPDPKLVGPLIRDYEAIAERVASILEPERTGVRPERPGDESSIHALHAASFPTDAEARLVSLLRQAGRLSVSLVAEVDGSIVGHVAFSPVSVTTGAVGVGLAPVAVFDSHRRQGIAARLIKAGLAACRSAGLGWAVVLGEPRYYARFGFRPASAFGLSDDYEGGPAFQALELIPGELPFGAGLVRYAPEFASLDSGPSAS